MVRRPGRPAHRRAHSCPPRSLSAAGKGSYASSPPAGQGKIDNSNLNLLQAQDRAIPTNHYWTNLLFKGNSGLWSYPLRVATDKNGLNIFFPTRFNSEGNHPAKGTRWRNFRSRWPPRAVATRR